MIWKSKRNRKKNTSTGSVKRRGCAPERLEMRRLLAADPIHVGVVYIETDYLESDQDVGSDSRGDRFVLSFTGGAPDTQLREVRIRTDKDGDGISVGDPIYDTEIGGRGKRGAHGFEIVGLQTSDGRIANVTANVDDGGQELVLNLSNFRSGDKLEFTLDVDEVLRNAIDLAVFNDRLDVITSGQEFQDSILEATFEAPHYEVTSADAVFLNDYGDPGRTHDLDLPPDEGAADSRPNRSAAAVASATQQPKPIEISGRVWLDNDLDLNRTSNETLLQGVEIGLWKFDQASNRYLDTGLRATTGSDGQYRFAKSLGILPGRYRLVETQPNGLLSVGAVTGRVDGVSSGVVESPDRLSQIDIPLGDTSASGYDFAEAQPASLSGFVFRDDNDNGVRDANEPGIAGVRVELIPVDAIAPQSRLTVRTGDDGSYQFTGLAPGAYEVIEVDQPSGLRDGTDAAGTVNGRIVGVAENPGDRITQINLDGGDSGVQYNFGELPLSSLTGYVYLLAPGQDCDGAHDAPGNTPLSGVELAIEDETGLTIATTRSASDGSYRFDQLTPGNYRIIEFTPDGLIDGNASAGRIGGVTVGSAVNGGLIQDITLTGLVQGVAYNFCEASPASISGYVYHDRSDDGQRDSGDTGISGATVSLVDDSGRVVATETTDSRGRYEFADVMPGQYSLRQSQPAGYLDGKESVGQVRGQSVGRVTGNDRMTGIELKQGDSGVEYNFGELLAATLAGRVHADLDADCEYDPGEATLEGVVIRVVDGSGNEVARTVTAADGTYRFDHLSPGTYTVIEEQPSGFFEGSAKPGSAGGAALGPSRIGEITLASGQVAVDYDFCERPPAEISGNVFSDSDGDCVFEPIDRGITGVRIELYDSGGRLVASTRTDSSGAYRFSDLPAGEYTVREIQPPGWIQGRQMAGDGGGNDSVTDTISGILIGWGDRLTQYNFCERPPASISGAVFVDGNGDCLQDVGERGIAGVTIELRDASGTRVARATTDANGHYRFGGLAAGEYQVFEVQPAFDANGDRLFDGHEAPGTGLGRVLANDLLGVTLLTGESLVDFNFCEKEAASISGRVWQESEPDRVFQPGEIPVPGVLVELIDEGGEIVATTRTDAGGNYRFDSIAPGVYSITETQPQGLFHGSQVVGSVGGQVGGDDLLVGIRLLSGVDATGYDFPEIPPASISGYVFQDGAPVVSSEPIEPQDLRAYSDGLLTPDDTRLPGVTVELRDASGVPLQASAALRGAYSEGPIRAVTDSDGFYEFVGLRPATYHVYQVQPEGYVDGLDTPGTTGGFAVNAADALSEQDENTIASLGFSALTDPSTDAILGIELTGGQESLENNFSEIIVVEPVQRQIPNVDLPDSSGTPIATSAPFAIANTPIRLATFAVPEGAATPFPDYIIDEWAVSWHLSVINAGFPVGGESPSGIFRSASAKRTQADWADGDHNTGRWTVPGREKMKSRGVVAQTMGEETRGPITLGEKGATPLTGDFDGDGLDEVAIFVAGQWFVDLNGNGVWDAGDLWIQLGTELDRPVVGDWDGDGKDDIGIFGRQWQYDRERIQRDPGLPDPENVRRREVDSRRVTMRVDPRVDDPKRLLRRGSDGSLRADIVDHVFKYGEQVDSPIAGDWNGDGIDQIAIFRGGQWLLDADGDGRWTDRDEKAEFGEPGDEPIVGDFNGDKIDEIGVVRGDVWIIDTDGDRRITGNDLHMKVPRPSESSQPVAGDYDGDKKDEPGYYDEAG